MAIKLNMIYTKADKALREHLNNDPDVEFVHGLLTAILCNPVLVPPPIWLGNLLKVAEGRGNILESEKEVKIFTDAIFNMYNYVNKSLKDGSFEPLISPEVELIDLKMTKNWCEGFFFAAGSWDRSMADNATVNAHLLTLFMFKHQDGSELDESERKQLKKLDKYVIDKRENIRNNVLGIYGEMEAMKPEPEPGQDRFEEFVMPIRVEPKINRNDPCPCGSGKKYKKCCGK
jgi:yecA family protein